MSIFRRKIRVLMVCTENVCRSPIAECLLKHHLQHSELRGRVVVDSAGTRTSQPGSGPDQRAQKVVADAGVNLGRIRARRITGRDFVRSDLILAMDDTNMQDLKAVCPPGYWHKVSLLLSHVPDPAVQDVPDPYYGSYKGFEEVFQLIDTSVVCLIPHIGNVGT